MIDLITLFSKDSSFTPLDIKTLHYDLGLRTIRELTKSKLVLTTNKDRHDIMRFILDNVPNTIHVKTTKYSSIGHIVYNGSLNIIIKKEKFFPGRDNEMRLVSTINTHTEHKRCLNIVLSDGNKSITVKSVTKASIVKHKRKSRNKADIQLHCINGSIFPISLKMDNAQLWESADTLWHDNAKQLIDIALTSDLVKIVPNCVGVTISPNVAVPALPHEELAVIFGDDILARGIVAIRTFNDVDFHFSYDNLFINVSNIIKHPLDILENQKVWFLIRNDKKRKLGPYKGLRVQAVFASRITSNIVKVIRD